jgi:hypothetical protein
VNGAFLVVVTFLELIATATVSPEPAASTVVTTVLSTLPKHPVRGLTAKEADNITIDNFFNMFNFIKLTSL